MTVNPSTLLFEGLTKEEIREMVPVLEKLIMKGELPNPRPPWMLKWLEAAGGEERTFLLMVSTAFPQRALLSIVRELLG